MGFIPFFKKKDPVLLRCTECNYEFDLSPREIRQLERGNRDDPVCPVREECHICHIGFMIPVKYIDSKGKQYLFHEIKPKIKNLDPDTLHERIFEHAEHENAYFFAPGEDIIIDDD